jgi:hypothetical protein
MPPTADDVSRNLRVSHDPRIAATFALGGSIFALTTDTCGVPVHAFVGEE